MSKKHYQEQVHVNIYEFKTNMSHYIRMMEAGLYRQLVIKRRNKPIGAFILFDREKHGAELDKMKLK